jgi:phospholipid transport system substrate-binding protein
MTNHAGKSLRALGRRSFLGLALASLATPALAEHPSVAFMRRVGDDLLAAHRQGTVRSFSNAIQRNADVSGIALYSLGQFKPKLSGGDKSRYFDGCLTFMARYFADQSREYRVAKYEVGEARAGKDGEVEVESTVYLLSGKSYRVTWKLDWRGGRYRVVDAKVLGFSLVYMQRGLFTSYISKRGGNVGALVAVLNQ